MSKIERYQGNLRAFASNAEGLERTIFGATSQADDLTSQITAAFLRGWGIVGASEHPSLEDFNGAMFAMSQFLAYQHQVGVPEWHKEQEYYVGSICTHNGESYQSLADSNVGNEPPSAKWTPILTSNNGLQNLGLGTAAKKDVGTGAGQIPDMSNFTYAGASNVFSSVVIAGNRRIMEGSSSGSFVNGVLNFTLPLAYPSAGFTFIPTDIGSGVVSYAAIPESGSVVTIYGKDAAGANLNGSFSFKYMAMGSA